MARSPSSGVAWLYPTRWQANAALHRPADEEHAHERAPTPHPKAAAAPIPPSAADGAPCPAARRAAHRAAADSIRPAERRRLPPRRGLHRGRRGWLLRSIARDREGAAGSLVAVRRDGLRHDGLDARLILRERTEAHGRGGFRVLRCVPRRPARMDVPGLLPPDRAALHP